MAEIRSFFMALAILVLFSLIYFNVIYDLNTSPVLNNATNVNTTFLNKLNTTARTDTVLNSIQEKVEQGEEISTFDITILAPRVALETVIKSFETLLKFPVIISIIASELGLPPAVLAAVMTIITIFFVFATIRVIRGIDKI